YMAEHHPETAHNSIPAQYNVGVFTNGVLNIASKTKTDDSKNKQGLPGEERVGEKPVEAKPDEGRGAQEAGRSGVVQTPSETEEEISEKEHQEIEDKVLSVDKSLAPTEVGEIATIYAHAQETDSPVTVKE